jgi:ArsR family transcriptional regulator
MKALSDESRLEIFRLIAAQVEPICVCDIVDKFDLTQPTVSHHLKVLRESGLISTFRSGNWAFYEANAEGLRQAGRALESVIPALELTR